MTKPLRNRSELLYHRLAAQILEPRRRLIALRRPILIYIIPRAPRAIVGKIQSTPLCHPV